MALLEFEPDTTLHPVDIIEHIAAINDWNFERQDTDEISISVRGSWSDYHVSFNWMQDLESLHIASAFDLKVPEPRRPEVKALIALVNEQLWIGHFDMWNGEGVILFRNSHLLTGGAEVSPQQCEALLRSATESCDLYYQAFQFVVWAGKSAAEALESVLFETVGKPEPTRSLPGTGEAVLAEQTLKDIGPVVLIGAGKMGLAMARGWIAGGLPPDRLVLVDPHPGEFAKAFAQDHGVRLLQFADGVLTHVLVLAVKPQNMPTVLQQILPVVGRHTLVLSIAAGISLDTLAEGLGTKRIVRTMPNTPAQLGKGITGAVGLEINGSDQEVANLLLRAAGDVVWFQSESMIDSVTAVSGSGPAYVFYLVEALAAAAVHEGFDPADALHFARQTVIGAAALLEADDTPVSTLRENVTSPKGTTAAALSVLMAADGLAPLIERTVRAARQRSEELGRA